MTIRIDKPELEERVRAEMKRGHFRSEAELIEKALDALDEQTPKQLNLESWKGRCKSSFDELGYAGVDEFIDDVRADTAAKLPCSS